MPHVTIMLATKPTGGAPAWHGMTVILVTGFYDHDHEIRFWEAWSGMCSRGVSRSGEAWSPIQAVAFLQPMVFYSKSIVSQSLQIASTACIPVSTRSPNPILYSKRLLAAAIHKKVDIEHQEKARALPMIASSPSTPMFGSSISFTLSSQARSSLSNATPPMSPRCLSYSGKVVSDKK